jgi:hypothetical protein
MDNSALRQSTSSSNISDPFRDPVLPSQTDQPEQPVPSNTSHVPTSYEVLPPSDINAPQIRGREVSNIHHQEQSRHALSSSQIGSDAIVPIGPGYHATSHDVAHGTSRDGTVEPDHLQSTNSTFALSKLVTRRVAGEPVDQSPEIIKAGKRKISITKWIFIIALLAFK